MGLYDPLQSLGLELVAHTAGLSGSGPSHLGSMWFARQDLTGLSALQDFVDSFKNRCGFISVDIKTLPHLMLRGPHAA